MAFSERHTHAVPAARAAPPRLALIVRVDGASGGARHCAFAAADVAEVMRPLPVEALPDMPEFVLGLSVIRGLPTPVIDAATLLGEPRGEGRSESAPTRFVVMRVGERRVALAVASVLGVRALAPETQHALPPLLQHAGQQMIAALTVLDSELLTVLGAGFSLPPAVWEALAPQRAPA